MKAFTIRTLRLEDSDPLLKFELENRDWFERHIEPRAADFYSHDGVVAHIQQFLTDYQSGSLHPCVIVDQDGHILGRANLKNIAAGSAEVGYRIAQQHTGSGLASAGLRYLIELARTRWQLAQLSAYVAGQNQASVRVLERCGFVHKGFVQQGAADGGTSGGVCGLRLALYCLAVPNQQSETSMHPDRC